MIKCSHCFREVGSPKELHHLGTHSLCFFCSTMWMEGWDTAKSKLQIAARGLELPKAGEMIVHGG